MLNIFLLFSNNFLCNIFHFNKIKTQIKLLIIKYLVIYLFSFDYKSIILKIIVLNKVIYIM